MSILEGSWRRSIRTVSHPATKFRHGRRLSCCDGHGLCISTVNPADEPRWGEDLAQPSFFACVLRQACVFHPSRFRLTSTRARRFLHPLGRAPAPQLLGSSSRVDHFLRIGTVVVRCKRSNRDKTDGAMGLRRGRTAFVFHRFYGVHHGNTLKTLLLVQFSLVRIRKTER